LGSLPKKSWRKWTARPGSQDLAELRAVAQAYYDAEVKPLLEVADRLLNLSQTMRAALRSATRLTMHAPNSTTES